MILDDNGIDLSLMDDSHIKMWSFFFNKKNGFDHYNLNKIEKTLWLD